jgi:hypothetical protein
MCAAVQDTAIVKKVRTMDKITRYTTSVRGLSATKASLLPGLAADPMCGRPVPTPPPGTWATTTVLLGHLPRHLSSKNRRLSRALGTLFFLI